MCANGESRLIQGTMHHMREFDELNLACGWGG